MRFLGVTYWPTIFLVKRKVKKLARQRGIKPIRVWWIGAIDLSPVNLALWVVTEKD